MDIRNEKLAKNLVNYSVKLKEGETILIECRGPECVPLVNQIVKEVYKVKGIPFVTVYSPTTERELLLEATEKQLNLLAKFDLLKMENMNAYISVRGGENAYENADVPVKNLELYNRLYSRPVHLSERIQKKWVVLRYPNSSMAQLSSMSQEAFASYYYDVCNLDYGKMNNAMEPLKQLMSRTAKVRITGPGTDLTFSIKGMNIIKCAGECNIPDGEVYTAPIRDSVNGVISYNTPSPNQGFVYEDVCLTFQDGKIIKATANDTERINKVFDTDEGARYIGEFAIGVNPYITKPMKDTLFDEKIMGSFHFTPGNSYKDAFNGNTSAVHWDLVNIQTKEFGGGEMYFDDVLIRKDGLFVLPELDCLNPENLK